jgi:hypothetical protein
MISYNLFPDVVFEGTLPLTEDIFDRVINQVYTDNIFSEKNYGRVTDKTVALTEDLRKLQIFTGSIVAQHLIKQYSLAKQLHLEITRPSVIVIKPDHQVSSFLELKRWYTGVVWLQTNDHGCAVELSNQPIRLYANPHGIYQPTHVIKPEVLKYAVWPSHIPASYTCNHSNIDNVMLQFTITGVHR